MAINFHKKKPGSHRVSVSLLAGAVPAWVAAPHLSVGMDWGAVVREGLAAVLVAGRSQFECRA
ncbi:hypothetical protein GCM10007866_18420 [Gluconobacter albidus]|uniref:Transposase n=1 Tax=Gluconobacter albidus TaxID=318683 RepID=A0ABQ5X3G9_9PROT|nr:hypothetical protein AA3250_2140 [Gluconobacter albidus NBRC 3250]GLQ69391.1 hypothetical protein GCM10007866_18420 [Gluconobacter albidus]